MRRRRCAINAVGHGRPRRIRCHHQGVLPRSAGLRSGLLIHRSQLLRSHSFVESEGEPDFFDWWLRLMLIFLERMVATVAACAETSRSEGKPKLCSSNAARFRTDAIFILCRLLAVDLPVYWSLFGACGCGWVRLTDCRSFGTHRTLDFDWENGTVNMRLRICGYGASRIIRPIVFLNFKAYDGVFYLAIWGFSTYCMLKIHRPVSAM